MGQKIIKFLLCPVALILCATGCAVLHHVQIGDIDNLKGLQRRPFEIKVSETGVNIKEVGNVAKAISRSKKRNKDIDDALGFIGLFQMGPRTGQPVFDDSYAKNILIDLYRECPSGKITNLTSIREMRKYPVISGEIVKITGTCTTNKATRNKRSSKLEMNPLGPSMEQR